MRYLHLANKIIKMLIFITIFLNIVTIFLFSLQFENTAHIRREKFHDDR